MVGININQSERLTWTTKLSLIRRLRKRCLVNPDYPYYS